MDMDISPTSARVPENFQESSLVASDLSGPQHGQFGENDTLKSAIFESGSRQVANFWSLSQWTWTPLKKSLRTSLPRGTVPKRCELTHSEHCISGALRRRRPHRWRSDPGLGPHGGSFAARNTQNGDLSSALIKDISDDERVRLCVHRCVKGSQVFNLLITSKSHDCLRNYEHDRDIELDWNLQSIFPASDARITSRVRFLSHSFLTNWADNCHNLSIVRNVSAFRVCCRTKMSIFCFFENLTTLYIKSIHISFYQSWSRWTWLWTWCIRHWQYWSSSITTSYPEAKHPLTRLLDIYDRSSAECHA